MADSRNIEEALVFYLSANTDLTAAIGTRLEPMKLAQGLTKPYLVYELMEDKPIGVGLNCTGPQLMKCVYKLLAVGDKEFDVNTIYDILRKLFSQPSRYTLNQFTGVAIRMLNGYHEREQPFLGADIYPFTKALFIQMQYVSQCP